MTVPPLAQMTQRHPVTILPADAPSAVAARKISQTFHETGSENVLIVMLTDDKGLGPADETAYRTLVDRLRQDTGDNNDIVLLQDFLSTPLLHDLLASQDGKAWILPITLAGELGTPKSHRAFTDVTAIVKETLKRDTPGSGLAAYFTGPAATVADLSAAGVRDRTSIELAIVTFLLVILLVIYRNPVTMLLPLITIGASLVTTQAVVAGVSLLTGLAISNQTIVLISAMVAGAGTDYAVFVISRYHDYVREGVSPGPDSARNALASIGKVIAASAATVAITFLGMGFAKLGVFATVGVPLAIGIAVAFLAAVTLLPAILVLAGPRGWMAPRRSLTTRFWRRSGVRIVRRPVLYLTASLVVLIALAMCASLIRVNYDDRKQLPSGDQSSIGYAALEQHFPVNQTIPEYLLIQSPHDLRTPAALADLERLAQRVNAVPGVAMVSGISRPTGEKADGHSARFFIQTDLNPFSTAAMDQVTTILGVAQQTARDAQPNTTLSDAAVYLSGYPATLRDTRDYYDHDIALIVAMTIVVVLLILTALLRAIVAPLYLVGSVILSYLSAIGAGVLLFQVLLRRELHWSVAGLAFVVLVAVGADYNMLLASRLRDESPSGVRTSVIRTVRSTGGVITAAGLIFASSMFGLLFASIATVVQAGFVIGFGILIDTFVVRTITVPALAALLGRASWWPTRPWRRCGSDHDPVQVKVLLAGVAEAD
jgi:uncharacterized membrane protein YdfJ with MMPL/SSD domain